MAHKWTTDDNYTAIGYLKYAIERYNTYVANAEDEHLQRITPQQEQKLIGCMHRSFDDLTELEAYNKA